ncbi:acetyl-CoA hydrolase/transferase family protein [Sporomusa sp. KB1]|uniref:acetyl-CoA hydrolase/transferase family protein n=1 Tax=Sporomusa sp. KB1 TaxID=943346 RepID=UPI0021071707|nr:acetyl-CoA hydrolase/transferase C-terminal domain-containing protein [Sporomusa sp. KB1]
MDRQNFVNFNNLFKLSRKGDNQMDWKQEYKKKVVTAEEAVKHIKSGDRLVFSHAVAEATTITDALVANKEQYENVEIDHYIPMGKAEYCLPENAKHFRHNTFCAGPKTRDAINSSRGDYTPGFFYETPTYFKTTLPVDVAIVQVSRPDKHGYCSYGLSVDYIKPAAEAAKMVIVEANDQCPRTFGDCFIHVSEIDYIVETSRPLIELQPTVITDVERAIGENCASLIEDGSTLQLGIGAIPDSVLLFLDRKKDLGLHSEMLSDSVVGLVEKGIITGKKKGLHDGLLVASFAMGTRRLYDFMDDNPLVSLCPITYVNDPRVIAQNNKVVSVNSCIQVDFSGQVVAESVGSKQISGVGGQVDFVRGATMSPGGKSIIACSSTTNGGKISKIVPLLDYGAAVTTSRNDVNYIITEYGIAQLKGKTIKQRARALINIAHPKFRDELIQKFEEIYATKF